MNANLPKIQVSGKLDKLIIPDDKLTKFLMTMTPDELVDTLNGEWLNAIEKNKGEAAEKQVRTKFKLDHVEGYSDMTPTGYFDWLCLSVCATAYKDGWQGLTIRQIYQALTHAKNWHRAYTIEKAVVASIERMMKTQITVDLSDTAKKMSGYKFKRLSITAPILPCRVEDWEVNGQRATFVNFVDESPLMEVATAKRQLLTIGTRLLDIACLRNSELSTIERKWYVILRACRILQRPKGKLNDTITFADLYAFANVTDAPTWKQKRIRDEFIGVLEKLKQGGNMTYKIIMHGKFYHAIKILS